MYSLSGSILFSVYLAYDTKMLVSGEHSKFELDPQEHVYGACKFLFDL